MGGSYEAEKKLSVIPKVDSVKLSKLTQHDVLYNTADHFSEHSTTTEHNTAP